MGKKQIDKIMEDTCFESLAYCCGLEKSCPTRDSVLKKLGLTHKEFINLKEKFNKNLYQIKGGKTNERITI